MSSGKNQMIASVHIARVGALSAPRIALRRPSTARVPGLLYAEPALTAPLGRSLAPRPRPGWIGLIAAWEDDEALDRFLEAHSLADRLAAGWHVRLEPLRVSGAWPAIPGLPREPRPVDDQEPVAVLTLGRLRPRRALSFLCTSAAAEGEAVDDPALLAATGLARPPHFVSTFSLWRSAAAMRDYAYRRGGAHQAAVRTDRAKPFHRESAFIRFRPYGSRGSWGGGDPLARVEQRA